MLLQAAVVLAVQPKAGTTITYDYWYERGAMRGPTAIETRVTERVDAVRPDGTYDATRRYGRTKATGYGMNPVGPSISGQRDRFTVGADGHWTHRDAATQLWWPEFPYVGGSVAVGTQWRTNGYTNDALAHLKEIRTFGGRRAAVIEFVPNPAARTFEDRMEPESYWVVDLADGRPLFARIVTTDLDRGLKRDSIFTLVRRGVRGLVPKL